MPGMICAGKYYLYNSLFYPFVYHKVLMLLLMGISGTAGARKGRAPDACVGDSGGPLIWMREEDPVKVEKEVNEEWKIDHMNRFKAQQEEQLARKYGRAGRLLWTQEEQESIDGMYTSSIKTHEQKTHQKNAPQKKMRWQKTRQQKTRWQKLH